MKSFLLACIAAIAIAAIGAFALDDVQEGSAQAYSTTNVRL
jgi:hypothetical protein